MKRSVLIGGIHAVCTRLEYRRRGYYRQFMAEVRQYGNRRYDTLLLYTAHPELYKPFSFREVSEHVFIAPWSSEGGSTGFRELKVYDAKNFQLTERLLQTREPVSHTLGVAPSFRALLTPSERFSETPTSG